MASGAGDTALYVRLAAPPPPGWSNNPDDLNINAFFDGQSVSGLLAQLGFTTIKPVLTDGSDTYIIQGTKAGKDTWFVWNSISGRLMQANKTKIDDVTADLKYGILNLDVVFLDTT